MASGIVMVCGGALMLLAIIGGSLNLTTYEANIFIAVSGLTLMMLAVVMWIFEGMWS
jgi:hypothetical protein